MMVLRRKGIALVRSDFIAAVLAPVDSGVADDSPGAMLRIEGCVIALGKLISIFIKSHGCFLVVLPCALSERAGDAEP